MDRLFIVPQVRQNRNDIIADLLALQQTVAVQGTNVDQIESNDKPGPRSSLCMVKADSPT